MNLRAKGVANFLFEKEIYPIGHFHRNLELLFIFQPLPADQRTDGHDRTGQGTTGLSPFGDPCGKSTSRLKDFIASHIHFFLQSCKNGLGSPKIIHIVLQRQFKDLFEQLFFTHPMSSSLDFALSTRSSKINRQISTEAKSVRSLSLKRLLFEVSKDGTIYGRSLTE
jgi:hypothetical protein